MSDSIEIPQPQVPARQVWMEKPMSSVRILIADDHEVVRRGVRSLLESRKEWDICGEAVDGQDAVNKAKELKPDVVVLDISMPHLNGFEAARLIRKEVPKSKILILSQHNVSEMIQNALDAGARGYVSKSEVSRDLLPAIEAIIHNHSPFISQTENSGEGTSASAHSTSSVRIAISDPQLGELDLLAERDHLRELFMQLPAAIGVMRGPEHRWTFVNPAYVRAVGRKSEKALLGKTIRESLPELNGQGFFELLDEVYRSGVPFVGTEMKVNLDRGASGQPEEAFFNFIYQPVRNHAGAVEGIFVHAVEVTDHVLARRAMEKNETRLHLAQAAAQIGTWEWDPVGKNNTLSRELHHMFGTEPSDPEHAQKWTSRVVPEDMPRVQAAMEESLKTGSMEFEYRYQHPERGLRWFYCKGRRFSPDEGRLFGVVLDITERKQIAEALRNAHDELEARVQERTAELQRRTEEVSAQADLLNLANDAIFVRTLDDKITYWNQGAERLYGWSREEVLGKPPHLTLRTEFPQPFEEIKAQLLRDGRWQGELIHSKRDGSRIIVASRWSVWRAPDGKPLGFLEVNTDITERKRAEEGLRTISGRLLQMQDEERRRIARELHDSAGQTLVALDMNLSSIRREAKLSPQALKTCNESLDLVKALSRELRTISHLLHPPLLDEAGLPSAVRWYVEGFAERSKINVSLELDADLGRLSSECETAIFRIVQECLTNIHRHSGSPTASIRISRNPREVKVEVRDQGKGISAQKQRNSGSMKRGVGIQGMQERVRQLGGRLEIHSGKDGTTVVAILPTENRVNDTLTPAAGVAS
jgi:PAS domain S-box-containing protein